MKPRFQPDNDPGPSSPPRLIDPEAYDASEQQFAASLEADSASSRPHFVVENGQPAGRIGRADSEQLQDGTTAAADAGILQEKETLEADATNRQMPGGLSQQSGPDLWREEVAARVTHYRARRHQRAPRYPSLQLKFENPEPPVNDRLRDTPPSTAPPASRMALATQDQPAAVPSMQSVPALPEIRAAAEPEGGAKILEFPRSSALPPLVRDELAEPIFVQPRILEVPAMVPPPPALGGILIEPVEEAEDERRPGFELPLQAAPLARRILAGTVDAALVATGFSLFAYTFFRITATVPPWRLAVSAALVLLATFWIGYQYLLLVYAGTTPGLRLAKLHPSRFDGAPVPRRLRRWRVLASAMSALALLLGYAWCFLDEDQLCWHDRITRTYMAPGASK